MAPHRSRLGDPLPDAVTPCAPDICDTPLLLTLLAQFLAVCSWFNSCMYLHGGLDKAPSFRGIRSKALVGFQGRGCADGIQPDFCHALLLEGLIFQSGDSSELAP